MRLFGFTPTNKMLLEQAKKSQEKVLHTGVILDVIHDGPIMETVTEIPTYKPFKTTVLSPMPSKKKPASELKRKVALNPLSN
jgi:hypothetical protein